MIWSLGLEGNSLVVMPVGSGKSVVIAAFASEVNEPILILVPSKELLEQDLEKLRKYVPDSEIGIFSASMNSKTINKFTFATIQSAYKHPELFAHFKIAIIDECHQVNMRKLDGMYNKLFKQMKTKVIGLTATPFRNDFYYRRNSDYQYDIDSVHCVKMINRYQERFWKQLIYVNQIIDLIMDDYLVPLTYHDCRLMEQDDIPINKSASDFDLEAYEKLVIDKESQIIATIQRQQNTSKSVLVFASSKEQANRLASVFHAPTVFGDTPKKDRERIINGFKDGSIKTVVNVNCLTTGFDHPQLDCIILARPTRSLSLHLQMLGRGTRTAEGKTTCDVYDFVGNVDYMGRIETMEIAKNDNKWDVKTEKGWWHLREVYRHKLKFKEETIKWFSKYNGII